MQRKSKLYRQAPDSIDASSLNHNAPWDCAYNGSGVSFNHGANAGAAGARSIVRNSRHRTSTSISDRDVHNITLAASFAEQIGLPLNSFRTIHFEAAGVDTDRGVLKAFAHFIRLATSWLRSQNSPTALVWVRESGVGKGAHVHFLMHLAPHLAAGLRDRQRNWLIACGGKNARGVFKSRAVGGSLRLPFADDDSRNLYLVNLRIVLGYMLKGAKAGTLAKLGFARCEPGGVIQGKRCGTSQNIGATARGSMCHP